MENLQDIYRQLTGVDIDVQRRIWDERGKGYYGEYRIFTELFQKVPGQCKFLMNLRIPTENGRTTEIDMVMLHETGIYLFESKYYKGTIYGNADDSKWTQFFRTSPNRVFNNPIQQNGYHFRALESLIPDAAIYSIIVFTNDDCQLRIENNHSNVIVTELRNLIPCINNMISPKGAVYSTTQVNNWFTFLAQYSSLQNQTVTVNENEILPFYDYINQLREDTANTLASAKKRAENAEQASLNIQAVCKKSISTFKRRSILASAAAIIITVCVCCFVCLVYKEICDLEVSQAQQELSLMQQNFQHIDAYADEYLNLINGMITISDIDLRMSTDLIDTAVFSCTINNNAKEYGIQFNEDTRYIIMLKNGSVLEYNMFGVRLKYNKYSQRIGGTKAGNSSGNLLPLEIYNIINIDDIAYIKLTNISLWKLGVNNDKPLKDGLSLQVYSS